MQKTKYADLFTLRKDGRYQGYWRELDRDGKPTGKRHAICDPDPERLYRRIQEKQEPVVRTFRAVAEEWEALRGEIVALLGEECIENVTGVQVFFSLD